MGGVSLFSQESFDGLKGKVGPPVVKEGLSEFRCPRCRYRGPVKTSIEDYSGDKVYFFECPECLGVFKRYSWSDTLHDVYGRN